MRDPAPESALVVRVPEAEPVVNRFRAAYDPSAPAGVPAHVTLLYPFKPPDALTEPVLAGLRHCFGLHAPFPFHSPTSVAFLAFFTWLRSRTSRFAS